MASFFENFPIKKIQFENIDNWISAPGNKILFLWGVNCPNCEIAKRVLTEYQNEVVRWEKELGIQWFHADVYENFEWAHRFGLKGIPHFMVFKDDLKIGKISPFPGWDPFREAIEKVFKSSIKSKGF